MRLSETQAADLRDGDRLSDLAGHDRVGVGAILVERQMRAILEKQYRSLCERTVQPQFGRSQSDKSDHAHRVLHSAGEGGFKDGLDMNQPFRNQ